MKSIMSFLIILMFTVIISSATGYANDPDNTQNQNQISLGETSPKQNQDSFINWTGDVLITDLNIDEAEPSLTSTPDGDLYTAVEHASDGWLRVYRSQDGGQTWQYIIGFITGDNSSNPSITYAKSNNYNQEWVYTAYEAHMTDNSKSVMVFRFDPQDPGSNYDFTTVESGIFMATPNEHIHPEICTDNLLFDLYYVYVTYGSYAIDYYPAMFSRSTDYGLNWSTPQNVTGSAENSAWQTRPDIAYGSSGLFIAFEKLGWSGASWDNQVWVTKSSNFGSTWTTPDVVTTSSDEEYHPRVAVAVGHDTAVVAYTRDWNNSGDLDICYSYTTNGGTTWTKELWLPWSLQPEDAVELAVSNSASIYHAAYWRSNDIHYTFTDAAEPNSWSPTVVVNDTNQADGINRKPAVCVNPVKPMDTEACVAWGDTRGTTLDTYFDTASVCAAVEIEKQVWDTDSSSWVNFVYASLDEILRFRCIISNSGCSNLTGIIATDTIPTPFMEYADSATIDGTPLEPTNLGVGEYQWDLSSRVLTPGNNIIIEFDAKVIDCGGDLNNMHVLAIDEISGWEFEAEDSAAVETRSGPDLIVTRIICNRQNTRIGYEIKNVGCQTIPAGHLTGLWIHASLEAKDQVTDPMPPGGTYESWFRDYTWMQCETLNKIEICADINSDVAEFDETNNCKVGGCLAAHLEWTWNDPEVEPNYNQVMMAPVAADLNDDLIPEVIFSTFSVAGGWQGGGILRAISGNNGDPVFSVTDPALRVQAGAEPAVADIDNDNQPEILVSKNTGEILCFEHDGSHKWTSTVIVGRLGIAIADLDQDGTPEIIAGNRVFNNNGTIRWTGTGGSNYVSATADLDLDGSPEVVTGSTAYRFDGTVYWSSSPAGRPAIANFDGDPYPEIVLVGNEQVSMKEHDGTLKWGPVNIPGRGLGPPLAADLDGDGELEIGVGGHDYYTAFETNGDIKWKVKIRDHSSRGASSSAFDFDGDGTFEIAYSDEEYHRVLRGSDGAILFETSGPSGTLIEQPIILDVDNDSHVEIVYPVNNYSQSGNTGIEVYGNDDCWPNARKIWNQHTYHITNIHGDATVPQFEINNWDLFNNFRTQWALPCNRCGDFDENNLINLPDLHFFTNNWLWKMAGYDEFNLADLNCDGTVNLKDYANLAIQWMDSCP